MGAATSTLERRQQEPTPAPSAIDDSADRFPAKFLADLEQPSQTGLHNPGLSPVPIPLHGNSSRALHFDLLRTAADYDVAELVKLVNSSKESCTTVLRARTLLKRIEEGCWEMSRVYDVGVAEVRSVYERVRTARSIDRSFQRLMAREKNAAQLRGDSAAESLGRATGETDPEVLHAAAILMHLKHQADEILDEQTQVGQDSV